MSNHTPSTTRSTMDTDEELHRAAAEMLIVGFPGAPRQVPDSVAQALRDGLGGIILFRRNIDSIDQFSDLTRSIHQVRDPSPTPAFVAVDQEGGRVVRLREPLPPIPPMRVLGDVDDIGWTQDVSRVMATELRATGVNLNFAPVVDIDTNPSAPLNASEQI